MRRDILEIDTRVVREREALSLSLRDVESIRLMLSGGSVIDWQRLNFLSLEEVDRFLALQCLDMGDSDDRERLRYVFNESVAYLEEHMQLRFPSSLRNPEDVREVFLWASQSDGFRRTQILSCVILKLMHVIHHMEAADLKFKTPESEERFFELAHRRILKTARRMRDANLPVVSFYGSRKSRSSIITKLLAKKDTLAATIFDKLRFRIIVESPDDLAEVLAWLNHHMFPFNYVIPGQSHNNLLDPDSLFESIQNAETRARAQDLLDAPELLESAKNEFSGSSYRMINFICDYPVRIPDAPSGPVSFELGKVVFVMVEFQILDEQTSQQNEQGENAHSHYKNRQHEVVARRLKRGGRRRR